MAENVLQTDCNNPHVLVVTLGCRLNQTESEAIARRYTDAGCAVSQDAPAARDAVRGDVSLVIVNTCAVTAKAQQKARREIRLLLDKCPNARIIVTGCYAALCADEIRAMDDAIRPLAYSPPDGRITVVSGKDKASIIGAADPFLYTDTFAAHSRASLKVQDGCDCDCAFCAIHIARGKSISLEAAEAVRRAKAIEANGYKEVALTGVNLGQWREMPPPHTEARRLPYLLRALLRGTSTLCFRLSSLHPDAIDDDFCGILSGEGGERIRAHFHLSVQSGSDKILRAMRRPYTRQDVLNAVMALRNIVRYGKCPTHVPMGDSFPRSAVSPFLACDIITGFPGESEADFGDTVSLCRECGFAHIHAFPFSPRPGTAAYSMRPCVPQSLSGERVKVLEEMSAQGMAAYVDECKGKVFSAIVEKSKAGDAEGTRRAVTENFLHVIVTGFSAPRFGGEIPAQGDEVMVRLTGGGTDGADAVAEIQGD